MINDPTVCCIMLTRDRPAMARQAVECFRAQTYSRKHLLIYNTSESDEIDCGCNAECYHIIDDSMRGVSIGKLRNRAISFPHPCVLPDIIVHWDDDDWSHPRRIEEQVALLRASGADCVGYREVLFWRDDGPATMPAPYDCGCVVTGLYREPCERHSSQAWLYWNTSRSYCIGSSMCYWRRAWERKPFADVMRGEDLQWQRGMKCVAASSMDLNPRMICRIHGGNTSAYADLETHPRSWRRLPKWDVYCADVFR